MLALALISVATAVAVQQSPPQPVSAEYRFVVDEQELVDDPRRAEVECSVRLGGSSGPLELSLPERIAFATLAEPRLADGVRLAGAGRLTREGPYRWLLEAQGGVAELRWTVPLDHHDLPEVAGDEYQFPYLREDHGMLAMGALALAPTGARPGRIRVRFEVPSGWPVLAPWPEPEPGVFEPGGWGPLQDDLVAIGGWSLAQADAAGVEVRVAVAGEQPIVEALALERIVPVVEAEVQLFGGPQHDRYLFLFSQPTRGGYGGSPRNTSMTLYVSPELPADFVRDGLTHLIAHEYHHTWMKATGFDPLSIRFFAEGFTDWYATLVPWWLGFSDERAVEDTLADKLFEFESGLERFDGSLMEAGGPAFFLGRGAAYETTYAGGLVLAAWLDLAIARERTGEDSPTLDDLMRDLYGDPRWARGERAGLDDLVSLVERYTDEDLARRFHRLAVGTGAPDLVEAFAQVGVELERRVVEPSLEIRANFDGTRVEAIDGGDLLARVGVASGDTLIAVNGHAVSSEAEVRAAWRSLRGGRVELVLVRAGHRDVETLSLALPETAIYVVPAGALAPCAR